MQTTLTSKGRMTLPIAARTRLGFEAGDHLMVTIQDDDTIILKRPPSAGVTALRGLFQAQACTHLGRHGCTRGVAPGR